MTQTFNFSVDIQSNDDKSHHGLDSQINNIQVKTKSKRTKRHVSEA